MIWSEMNAGLLKVAVTSPKRPDSLCGTPSLKNVHRPKFYNFIHPELQLAQPNPSVCLSRMSAYDNCGTAERIFMKPIVGFLLNIW